MAQIRGYFPLPFSSPQATQGANVVTLGSGGVYYPPAGEYIITTGGQTIIQWFDPDNYLWRNYGGPNSFEQISTDGSNYRLVNLSGVAVGGNITNPGSGGTNGIGPNQTGSTVTFGAPLAGGVTATAQGYVVVGGTVAAPTIAQAGSGFLVPPLIACDPPPVGGVQATFTATVTAGGALAAIAQVNPGAGYTSVPQFYIVPQPQFYQGAARFPGDTAQTIPAPGLINPIHAWTGSPFQANIISGAAGALLTLPAAVTGSGTLTAIAMTYFGNGYTANTIPTISFAGVSLGAAAATAIMSMCLNVTTVVATGGSTWTVGNAVETSLGLVANSNDNNFFFPRPGRGIVSNATGPQFTVEDPGFGFQKLPVPGMLFNSATAQTGTAAIPALSVGGISDTSILQPMVQ